MHEDNFRKITCAVARDYDMVDYLSKLGIEVVKIRGNDFWYHSPLRQEKTPSFKINRKMNRWFDFGEGAGGNLIDFAIRYNNCTAGDFLQMLADGQYALHQPGSVLAAPAKQTITILGDHSLRSTALLNYLKERRIPLHFAENYCREVCYQLGKGTYSAIGFKNNSGGFELRNEHFKGSSSPKDITTILNKAQELSVVEGSFDFLSYLVMIGQEPAMDFLILNSLALFDRALPIMEQYAKVHLYLDNDKAGKNCVLQARSVSDRYVDESALYHNYKDLNDFLGHKPIDNGEHDFGEHTA